MAKRFDDLSDEEVLALSEDDLQRWIDVECAFAGVPLLPDQPVEPEAVVYEQDLTVYQVGSISFADVEDATKFAGLASAARRMELGYKGGPRYEKTARPKVDLVSVDPVACYSPARWDAIKGEVLAYQARKAQYDTAMKEYAEAVEKRNRVAEDLVERRDRVVSEEYKRSRLRTKLERYRVLADGNESTARKFLRDAHPEAADLLPELNEPIDLAARES